MLYSGRYGASSSSLLAYMNSHTRLKRSMAGLVRWRPSRWLLRLAVRLFAPQHRVGVSVIVINTDQQILLLKHVYHPTLPWGPPGGWLDKGEDPRTGAARELREETGITAEIGPLLLLEHQTPPDHIGIAYLAQLPSPAQRLPSTQSRNHHGRMVHGRIPPPYLQFHPPRHRPCPAEKRTKYEGRRTIAPE